MQILQPLAKTAHLLSRSDIGLAGTATVLGKFSGSAKLVPDAQVNQDYWLQTIYNYIVSVWTNLYPRLDTIISNTSAISSYTSATSTYAYDIRASVNTILSYAATAASNTTTIATHTSNIFSTLAGIHLETQNTNVHLTNVLAAQAQANQTLLDINSSIQALDPQNFVMTHTQVISSISPSFPDISVVTFYSFTMGELVVSTLLIAVLIVMVWGQFFKFIRGLS